MKFLLILYCDKRIRYQNKTGFILVSSLVTVYIMFRVLLLLATFVQVYFNLLNLQQMIIINAFHGLRRRRLIAI